MSGTPTCKNWCGHRVHDKPSNDRDYRLRKQRGELYFRAYCSGPCYDDCKPLNPPGAPPADPTGTPAAPKPEAPVCPRCNGRGYIPVDGHPWSETFPRCTGRSPGAGTPPRPTCDTPGCGREIPTGGEGHPEICPKCLADLDAEDAARTPGERATGADMAWQWAKVALEAVRAERDDARTQLEAAREALGRIKVNPLACTCLGGEEDADGHVDHYVTCPIYVARRALAATPGPAEPPSPTLEKEPSE